MIAALPIADQPIAGSSHPSPEADAAFYRLFRRPLQCEYHPEQPDGLVVVDDFLWINQDNDVVLNGLINGSTGEPIDDAVVTAYVRDAETMSPIGAPCQVAYVVGSEGNYRGVFDHTKASLLQPGGVYLWELNIESAGFNGVRRVERLARYRWRSAKRAEYHPEQGDGLVVVDDFLWINQDNDVVLNGLINGSTREPIDDAVVTAYVRDAETMSPIGAPCQVAYVVGSEGNYRGVFDHTKASLLQPGGVYLWELNIESAGFNGVRRVERLARYRWRTAKRAEYHPEQPNGLVVVDEFLWIRTNNEVFIQRLTNGRTRTPINDATVIGYVKRLNNDEPIGAPFDVVYVAQSDGNYRGVFDYTKADKLEEGWTYYWELSIASPSFTGYRRILRVAAFNQGV